MLTLPVLRYSLCDRLRACWPQNGPGFRGGGGKLRMSVHAHASVGDDGPMRATRKNLEDGSIQYLFYDIEDAATTPPELDRSHGEMTDTDDDTESDDGTETEDEAIEDEQRDDILNDYTVKQLKKMCKENGVKGYSTLRKGGIIKLLRTSVSEDQLPGST